MTSAGFGSQLVADRDGADDLSVVLDEDGGGAGVLHPLDLGGQRAGVDPAGTAETDGPALEPAFQARAGDGVHVGDGRPVRGGGEDGAGERVFAAGFQPGGEGEDLFPGRGAGGGDVDHGGLVPGQGAGLVQRDGADFAEGFQGAAALDEHADAAGGADGGDDGDGHGDGQRAGRGGDQDDEGAFEPEQRFADDEAEDDDQGRGDQDARDEFAGDGVGQALAGALAGLLGLDDVHDPGQRVVLRGAGDFDLERAGAVDGPGVDLGPRPGLDGHGFPGERGGVQGGAAGDDPCRRWRAVHRAGRPSGPRGRGRPGRP